MRARLTAREKERGRLQRWERNFVYKQKEIERAKRVYTRSAQDWLRPLADAANEQQRSAWLDARRRHGYLPAITHPNADWAIQ